MIVAASKPVKVLNYVSILNNKWIIGYGAKDHMTFNFRQVTPLITSSQKFVSTTNGDPILVVGESFISLSNTLNLDSMLVRSSLVILNFIVCCSNH